MSFREKKIDHQPGRYQRELFQVLGRACIISLNQLRRVTRKEVILADGTALPLPGGAYEALNRAMITRTNIALENEFERDSGTNCWI